MSRHWKSSQIDNQDTLDNHISQSTTTCRSNAITKKTLWTTSKSLVQRAAMQRLSLRCAERWYVTGAAVQALITKNKLDAITRNVHFSSSTNSPCKFSGHNTKMQRDHAQGNAILTRVKAFHKQRHIRCMLL